MFGRCAPFYYTNIHFNRIWKLLTVYLQISNLIIFNQ